MQDEIQELYENIKDKLTKDEFLAEMEEARNGFGPDVPFVTDLDCAKEVLKNHGIEIPLAAPKANEEVPFEISSVDGDNEFEFTMNDDILELYQKVQDKISQEDFLAKMKEFKNNDPLGSSDGFEIDPITYANMVVGEFVTEEVETISERPEYAIDTIDKLEKGSKDVTISGRVISISNPRSFKTRKGASGEVCNVELQDNTGKIRAVFWTQNIKLLKNVNEGNIIQIKNVDIKEGFSGLEANLRPRSTVIHLQEDPSKFPVYEEEITNIADIEPDSKVNIIARIVRVSTIRSYEKNGKEGEVASLELKDASGEITYTLWNKNVELIKDLGLEDGDTVKILQAQARERINRDGESEISLTHWDGRIIKGDFDVPEVVQEFTPIADVSEKKNVNIKGIVARLQDIKTFTRKTDNTEGRLRNFDVRDMTGDIRVTVWGDDTELPINKGDIVKIIGGDVRYDEYTQSQYSMNTNFNTQITINPQNLSIEEFDELESLRNELRPTPIGEIYTIDDDGVEIDIVGRILSVEDINEFERDDGSVGLVRSLIFADESGKVRLALWNERAQDEYTVGDAYQIENARTRLGMYSVDLNIGSGARLIKLSEEQASALFIPELATLEKNLYDYKKIDDLDEDDQDVIIIGRIIELYDIREFERDDGTSGYVKNLEIADDTGSIRIVLWDNDAKKEFEMGQAIKLQNPRIGLDRDNRIEATVTRNTAVLEPSQSELDKLPSQEELMDAIYVSKTIESLAEDDTNVCVTGRIIDVSTDKIILKKCPNCRANVDESDMEDGCQYCGHVFDEPNYILMIPTRIEDETGEIQVTFFDNLAEELIGMEKGEVISLAEEGLGIEDKLQDLQGQTIEIIANVSFDEYGEENRLNPKRIISKYY